MKKIVKTLMLTAVLSCALASILSSRAHAGSFIVKNEYAEIRVAQNGMQGRTLKLRQKNLTYNGFTTVSYSPKGKSAQVLFKIEDIFHINNPETRSASIKVGQKTLLVTYYVDITRCNNANECMIKNKKIKDVYVEILTATLDGVELAK